LGVEELDVLARFELMPPLHQSVGQLRLNADAIATDLLDVLAELVNDLRQSALGVAGDEQPCGGLAHLGALIDVV
jgi:hypothetical protein